MNTSRQSRIGSLLPLVTLSLLASCGQAVDFGTAPAASLIQSGTVEVVTKDTVRFHVLNFGTRWTSTIVESETGVTLVDVGINTFPNPGAQDLSNSGTELRAYADAIKKPMSVIVTHDHVDHFINLDKFRDVPVFAETATATLLKADPAFTAAYPGEITAVAGAKSVGGFEFQFATVSGAEAAENGYVYIPSEEAVFTGDLTAINKHSFIRDYTPLDDNDELLNWANGLKSMKTQMGGYEHVFVGHLGYSTNVAENFDDTIGYLTAARGLIKGTQNLPSGSKATSVQQVVDELKRLYPKYEDGGLLFAMPGAFGPMDPGAKWF